MKQTVLFVDDEKNVLSGLVRLLHHQPYQTLTARSAEEAIQILKSHPIDLVVSDENMPGMCGTEFLAWVAQELPDVVRIVLTGQPSVAAAMRAINEGRVYRFLTKPCDPVQLAITIRKGLEQKVEHKQYC